MVLANKWAWLQYKVIFAVKSVSISISIHLKMLQYAVSSAGQIIDSRRGKIHEHHVNDLPDNNIMIMPSLIRPMCTSHDDIIMKCVCMRKRQRIHVYRCLQVCMGTPSCPCCRWKIHRLHMSIPCAVVKTDHISHTDIREHNVM